MSATPGSQALIGVDGPEESVASVLPLERLIGGLEEANAGGSEPEQLRADGDHLFRTAEHSALPGVAEGKPHIQIAGELRSVAAWKKQVVKVYFIVRPAKGRS